MNSIKISLDPYNHSAKPQGKEIAQISQRIACNTVIINNSDIEKSFIIKVGLQGYTFCPATFKDGRRRKENFEQQQLFALDFDNKSTNAIVTFEDIKERADKYDLPILFAYETFSSTHGDKFRVILKNDVSITDIRIASAIQMAIGTIFSEADSSCYKDVSKMYFGGNKSQLLYYDAKSPEINIDTLFRSLTSYYKELPGGDRHYKEKLSRFSKNTGIALNQNKLLDVTITDFPTEKSTGATTSVKNGGTSPVPIINDLLYIKGSGENPPLFYCINFGSNGGCTDTSSVGNITTRKASSNHKSYRSNVLKDLNKCRLYSEFYNGSRKLAHDELLGIANNIIHIETGPKEFLSIIEKFPEYYACKEKRWNEHIKYNIQNGYKPSSCENFCPYHEQCEHSKNILTTIHPKRGNMEKIENYHQEYYSLECAQQDTYDAIYRAFCSDDKQVHVIKAQCSIGKSTSYLKIMKENPNIRFLIAAPTNILKEELYQKATKFEISACMTPSLEPIMNDIPPKIKNHIQRLYTQGQHKKVHPFIHQILTKNDIPCLSEYMKERNELKTFKGSIITTHRYLLSMDDNRLNEFDAIIIDEDIIFKSVISNQGEITVLELKHLLNSTSNELLKYKINYLLNQSPKQTLIKADSFKYVDDDITDFAFDVPSFCAAEYFYFRKASSEPNLKKDTFSFIKPSFLSNRKYIIVSATADKEIYSQFFNKDRINFYECKQTRYKGKLYQYPQRSMSRSCLSSHPEIIKNLMEQFNMNENHVITFMNQKIGDLHFGNTEGSNSLEGEDILVIGTPYHIDFLYKLVTFYLGYEFDPNEKQKSEIISHNGYKSRFTTYSNEHLRAIQFWMIESELEQAIGRARLLRNDCKVHLFSNFPLRQAEPL